MSPRLSDFDVRGPCAFLGRLACIAVFALVCGASLGQAAPNPRIIPAPPLPGESPSEVLWHNVQIPLLPAGASLGALWADNAEQLYVWAVQGGGTAGPQGTGGPRGGLASAEGSSAPHSMLFHWNGYAWKIVLDLTRETGVSIFGSGPENLFAATSAADGAAKMYHFDGRAWTGQALPAGTLAPAGAIAGAPDDVYFRAGRDVLRYDGNAWQRVFTGLDRASAALTYIGPNEVYANCCSGHCCWDGAAWCHHDCGAFRMIGASWGIRELQPSAAGMLPLCEPTLSMYAAGRSPVTDGFAAWKFVESPPGSMRGQWVAVPLGSTARSAGTASALPMLLPDEPADPPGVATTVLAGEAVAVWGTSGSDIYLAGTQSNAGLLYHFDGVSWRQLRPLVNMPPVADVRGSGPGNVWVSFQDGHLLHYTGGPLLPNPVDLAPGTPDVSPVASSPLPAMTTAPRALATRVVSSGHGLVTLEYAVSRECLVSVAAFDVSGRCIASLERGPRRPGRYQLDWNTAGLARGVYFYQVRAGEAAGSHRLVLLD